MTKHENKPCRSWQPSKKMFRVELESRKNMLGSDHEFEKALAILEKHPKRVTMFGSARDLPNNEIYRDAAHSVAYGLAEKGYAIVSGGGHGIMGASNKGAFDAGGASIGFNIKLPHEQKLNEFTTENLAFHYFFTRKVMMTFFSRAYIFFPGGFGTLDELTEIITMIQTKKMPPLKVILYGHDFWDDWDVFVEKQLLNTGYISLGDEKLYTITDDIDEVIHLVDCSASD